MAQRVIYEGPATGLLERVAELGDATVRLVAVEDVLAPRQFDPERLERNHEAIARIMKGAPTYPGRIFTSEDYYGPDE